MLHASCKQPANSQHNIRNEKCSDVSAQNKVCSDIFHTLVEMCTYCSIIQFVVFDTDLLNRTGGICTDQLASVVFRKYLTFYTLQHMHVGSVQSPYSIVLSCSQKFQKSK